MDNKLAASLLTGKKFSFEERKLLFVGIVTQTLYDTERFKRNADLGAYLHPFEKYLNKNELFKNYLYKSRTLLSARVTRLIINNTDRNITTILINEHLNFINRISAKNVGKKNNKAGKSNLLDDILRERIKQNE